MIVWVKILEKYAPAMKKKNYLGIPNIYIYIYIYIYIFYYYLFVCCPSFLPLMPCPLKLDQTVVGGKVGGWENDGLEE